MSGGHSAWWTDELMAKTLTSRAEDFMADNRNRPFFLYFAINDIHVPRAPNPQFVGKSGLGLRGDQLKELDYATGQIMDKLKALHLTSHTLVIFSSDNGPILNDGYSDGSVLNDHGHKPAGPFRGGKYQIYEGGTRVPFITYWPGHVKIGVSSKLISQVDLLASLTDLAGIALPTNAGPDSHDLLPALFNADSPGREQMVEQSERILAIRRNNWKYIPQRKGATITKLEEGDTSAGPPLSSAGQLYDLATDPGEKKNVAAAHPEVVRQLGKLLKQDVQKPRTR